MTNEQGQRRKYGLGKSILTIGVLATALFSANKISDVASDYSNGKNLPAYQEHVQAQQTTRQTEQGKKQLEVLALIHDYIDRRQGESAHYSAHQAGIKAYLQGRHYDVGEEAIDGIIDGLLGDKAEEIKKKNVSFSLYDLRAQSKPIARSVSPDDPNSPSNWKIDLRE